MRRRLNHHAVPPQRVPRGFWTLFWIWWSVVWLLEAWIYRVNWRDAPPDFTWVQALITGAGQTVPYVVTAAIAVQVARRMAESTAGWTRQLLVFLAALVVSALAKNTIDFFFLSAMPWMEDADWISLLRRLPRFIQYLALVFAAAYGAIYFLRYHERQLTASRLASELSRAHLDVLKAQLNPHFLFNTLNSISALVRIDPSAAERTIAQLSDLLRSSLTHGKTQEVTLAEELEFLQPYLDIERTRYGSRLQIHVQAPHDLLDAIVPHLILQPLVENAIRHGIAPRPGPGHVTLSVEQDGPRIRLQVADDGIGLPKVWKPGTRGIGLTNVRARLEHLYGEHHEFQIRSVRGQGLSITIEIPLRRSGDLSPARRRGAVTAGVNGESAPGF